MTAHLLWSSHKGSNSSQDIEYGRYSDFYLHTLHIYFNMRHDNQMMTNEHEMDDKEGKHRGYISIHIDDKRTATDSHGNNRFKKMP
mmetsp:Transcript_9179/g.10640  ORF Transcript_9179/g.10640 Transcript_9179/m.10640 type:complete len:86 (+) Transcript_9179:353-610(+)